MTDRLVLPFSVAGEQFLLGVVQNNAGYNSPVSSSAVWTTDTWIQVQVGEKLPSRKNKRHVFPLIYVKSLTWQRETSALGVPMGHAWPLSISVVNPSRQKGSQKECSGGEHSRSKGRAFSLISQMHGSSQRHYCSVRISKVDTSVVKEKLIHNTLYLLINVYFFFLIKV